MIFIWFMQSAEIGCLFILTYNLLTETHKSKSSQFSNQQKSICHRTVLPKFRLVHLFPLKIIYAKTITNLTTAETGNVYIK